MTLSKRTQLDSGGFAHVMLAAGIAAGVVVIGIGFLVFQTQADSKYQTNVKAAYGAQSAKMNAAYEAFTKPVFSSNDTTTASDATDIAAINAAIIAAKSETNNLAAKNKLTVLPGTTLLSSVNKTNKEHKNVQKYVNDSNTFLNEFQMLSTYKTEFDKIGNGQLTDFFNSLSNLTNDATVAEISTDIQSASTSLNGAIAAMKNLKPSADVQKLNTDVIANLTTLSNDLKSITATLSGTDQQQMADAITKLGTDLTTAQDNIAKDDVTSTLQKNSVVHTQIVSLKAENPLTN